MKPLKESMFWKVLLILIVVIAVPSLAWFSHQTNIDKKATNENRQAYNEAIDAGYDERYFYCTKNSPVTIEGITYQSYSMVGEALMGVGPTEEILLLPGIVYKDDTNGATEGLVIFARTVNTDTEDSQALIPGKYRIVEPYRIAVYQKGISLIGTITVMVFVGYLELLLVIVLITYLIAYAVIRRKDGVSKG